MFSIHPITCQNTHLPFKFVYGQKICDVGLSIVRQSTSDVVFLAVTYTNNRNQTARRARTLTRKQIRTCNILILLLINVSYSSSQAYHKNLKRSN